MNVNSIHDQRAAFLNRIENLLGTDLCDAFSGEIREQGGNYEPPKSQRSHLFEIALHDVIGRGLNEQEAVADWIAAAGRMEKQPLERDGFNTAYFPAGQNSTPT